jgi:hypothetical protein
VERSRIRHSLLVARRLLAAGRGAAAARRFAMTPFGNLDSNERALERCPGAGEIDFLSEFALEHLLGFASSTLGSFQIDLSAQVGSFSKNYDAIGTDLQEAAEDGEFLLCRTLLEPQDALSQQRNQRRVVRQNAQLPLRARHYHLIHVPLERLLLRSNDLQVKGHLFHPFF